MVPVLWTCGQGRRVLDGRERCALSVRVRARGAGGGVGHGGRDLDVREAGREGPVALVRRAAVEDLDDELDVGRVEEPEVAGVRGETDAVPVARGAVAGLPVRGHAEAAVIQAQSRSARDALGRRGRARGEPKDLVPQVVGDPDRAVGSGSHDERICVERVVLRRYGIRSRRAGRSQAIESAETTHPQVAIGASHDPACGAHASDLEPRGEAGGRDLPDPVPVPFAAGQGEPEVAVRAGDDLVGEPVGARQGKFRNGSRGRDPADPADLRLGEPEVAVGPGRKASRLRRYGKLDDRAGGRDPADRVRPGLGEPDISVGSRSDVARSRLRIRQGKLGRGSRGRHPADAPDGGRVPDVAVGPGAYEERRTVQCRELADGPVRVDASDRLRHVVGEPDRSVRTDRDARRGRGRERGALGEAAGATQEAEQCRRCHPEKPEECGAPDHECLPVALLRVTDMSRTPPCPESGRTAPPADLCGSWIRRCRCRSRSS